MRKVKHSLWTVEEKPKLYGKVMRWGGKRAYRAKSDKLSLKLGEANMIMYFQFYSQNFSRQHWGKSKMAKLLLSNGVETEITALAPKPRKVV